MARCTKQGKAHAEVEKRRKEEKRLVCEQTRKDFRGSNKQWEEEEDAGMPSVPAFAFYT